MTDPTLLEMNGKKLSRFQFHLLGVLETSTMLEQERFFFFIWTSEIIPFIRFGKQMDLIFFLKCQKLHLLRLSNFALTSCGHFPTRNGLKLPKV